MAYTFHSGYKFLRSAFRYSYTRFKKLIVKVLVVPIISDWMWSKLRHINFILILSSSTINFPL
jgi:hypothetical protein